MNIRTLGLIASLLLILPSFKAQASEVSFLHRPSVNEILGAAGAAMGVFLGYKLIKYVYNQSKKYVENTAIDATVDTIVLALTPPFFLNQMSDAKKEEGLRKKARLINMRKRILNALKVNLPDTLSEQHRMILAEEIRRLNLACGALDTFRQRNPFEEEYKKASLIDQAIEKSIINSVILATKPDSECTQKELDQKKAKAEYRAKVIAKIKSKIAGWVSHQIERSLLFSSMLIG